MGTIAGDARPGLIYLHKNTNQEFSESLSKTEHKTADTFLNELIDLFVKGDEQSQALQVSSSLAFKFLALLSGTTFENGNDLMKHLLNLYSQSQAVKSKNTQNIPQERSSNRKRKSQPRRNVKLTVLNGEDDDIVHETIDDVWIQKSEGRDEVRPTDVEGSSGFDLSVVKQEQPDQGEEGHAESKDGDPHPREAGGLKLQKTPSLLDARHLDAMHVRRMESQLRMLQQQQEKLIKEAKAQPRSELSNRHRLIKPKTSGGYQSVQAEHQHLMNGVNPYSIMNQISGSEKKFEKKRADVDHVPNDDNYTYVLNSLDSPGLHNGQNTSLPASPMHVPVKYPKSNPYYVSSDEEAQDLSYTNEQPQNLTLAKNENNRKAKTEHVIKYDKNGNTLPELLPLTSPQGKRYPAPANLIFNDLQAMNDGLAGDRHYLTSPTGKPAKNMMVLSNGLISPNQTMSVAQDTSKIRMDNQSGMKSVAMTPIAPVRFQVLVPGSQQMAQPVFMQNQLISPSQAYPGMPLLMAVSSPDQVIGQGQRLPPVDPSLSDGKSDNSGSEESRRKRKKMDDTTCFRDPPETSLPFNGPNKYRFFCDVCDTGFTRRYTFNRHKCKGRVEKHYCQLCDKAYLSKYKLKDHILVKHEGQTVNCPDCGKKFSSRSSMEMHKKQQHEGQFSIWCKICGKGFNHTGHYYGHMNKHTNTKPFWCQQCGKRFFGSSYLHNHKQVCRGNNDLNYNCHLCERKFKCELYLKKHMKVHEANPGPILMDQPEGSMDMSVDNTHNEPVGLLNKPREIPNDNDEQGEIEGFKSAGGAVFPNGPDSLDSNSNPGMLTIDELETRSMDEEMRSSEPGEKLGDGLEGQT